MSSNEDQNRCLMTAAKMQTEFKFCYALMINSDFNCFEHIQSSIPCGNLRFFLCRDYHEAFYITAAIVKSMDDVDKLKNQQQYFAEEAEESESSSQAREISKKTLLSMNLNNQDAELIIDCCGSIAGIMTTDASEIANNCPVEKESIDSLSIFFNTNIFEK